MKLFDNFFKFRSKPQKSDDNIPSVWEDDYCQIEIISLKNLQSIATSVIQIQALNENEDPQNGFTNIVCREKLPFPTLNEQITVDSFERILTNNGFEQAKQIRYGNKIISCNKTTTNAFHLSCFRFFYDYKEDYTNNIWITSSLIVSTEDFEMISKSLSDLGERYHLALIDWNSLALINLTDKKQITNYLMGYWK